MSADQNDADKIANALASYQQPRAMVSRGVQELIRAPALWDLKRLETEVRANGFQAVTAQLRGATGFDRVDTYLRILEFDTFAHRNGVPEELPGLFLQTVRNRAFQLGEFGVQHEAEKLLTDRGLSHLAAVRRTGPENPNTVRIVERARLSTFGPERIFTIVAHGDGGEYIVGYEAGMVESWNAQTGSRVWAVQIQGLTGLAVSEATSSLVTSSRAGYLGRRICLPGQIWEVSIPVGAIQKTCRLPN